MKILYIITVYRWDLGRLEPIRHDVLDRKTFHTAEDALQFFSEVNAVPDEVASYTQVEDPLWEIKDLIEEAAK